MEAQADRPEPLPFHRDHPAAARHMPLATGRLAGRTGSPLPHGVTPCGMLRSLDCQTSRATGTNALVKRLFDYAQPLPACDLYSLLHTPLPDGGVQQAALVSVARHVALLPDLRAIDIEDLPPLASSIRQPTRLLPKVRCLPQEIFQ